MSTFNYTYRDKFGALKDASIEAENRTVAFRILKTQGIVPVSVKASPVPKRKFPAPSLIKISFIAGTVVVIAIIVLAVLLLPRTNVPSPTTKSKLNVIPNTSNNTSVVRLTESKKLEKGASLTGRTNLEHLNVLTNYQPAVTNYLAGNRVVTNKPPRVYNNPTEQMLHVLFATPIGSPPPPMPRIPNFDKKRMKEILDGMMSFHDTDSEHSLEQKQIIDQARQALKEYVTQGGDPDDFMYHYSEKLRQYHEDWIQSQRMAVQSCLKEDPDVARQMVDVINTKLAEKGIKPVKLPPKLRAKIGLVESQNGESK